MNEERLIREALEKLDIKGYELKAYLTILKLGEETAPVIASESGIPLPRIYSVLESLLKKGLIEVKMGRPRKYRALPPSISLIHYVRRKINELTELATNIVEVLSSYYRGVESSREEPVLWMMYNVDVGVERVKHLISNMKVDGFASMNPVLLKKIANTLTKTLGGREKVFGLAVISGDLPSTLMDPLEQIKNIAIRVLPTGIVNLVEVDLANIVLFGRNYVINSGEWELIVLANESFYHGYWRLAKKVKDFDLERNTIYKTTHHWLALDLIDNALSNNYNVYLRAKGFKVRSREPVEVRGYVKKLLVTSDGGIRSIYVEDDEGNTISIGGIGASIEDVEARYIEIHVH